jgi:hypothetical protein
VQRVSPPTDAVNAPQNGAAGSAPRHMTPGACHCAACRAAHVNTCVVLRMGLLRLFHGKAYIVDLVLRHHRGASGWDTARFDAAICCVQYGPAGDVIAAGAADGLIHLICAQTGEKILSPLKGHRDYVGAVAWSFDGRILASGSDGRRIILWDAKKIERLTELKGHSNDNKDCTCEFDEDEPLSLTHSRAHAHSHCALCKDIALQSKDIALQSKKGERLTELGPEGPRWPFPAPEGPQRLWNGHSGSVYAVAWSIDGLRALLARRHHDRFMQRFRVWQRQQRSAVGCWHGEGAQEVPGPQCPEHRRELLV